MTTTTHPTADISPGLTRLLAVAAGLIVAIACLFPFNFLVAQLKRRTTELEQVTHHFELAYNTGNAQKTGAAPAPAAQP